MQKIYESCALSSSGLSYLLKVEIMTYSQEENDQTWLKEIESHLLGKKIVKLRLTTNDEQEIL